MPRPNPNIVDPTKYRGDCCRKKKPTPKPTITPPPIAQVLLSFLLFDINVSNRYNLFITMEGAISTHGACL